MPSHSNQLKATIMSRYLRFDLPRHSSGAGLFVVWASLVNQRILDGIARLCLPALACGDRLTRVFFAGHSGGSEKPHGPRRLLPYGLPISQSRGWEAARSRNSSPGDEGRASRRATTTIWAVRRRSTWRLDWPRIQICDGSRTYPQTSPRSPGRGFLFPSH